MSVYSNVKEILLRILPKAVLFRCEPLLRFIYYLGFMGNTYQCRVCGKTLRAFVKAGNERICPRCGSLPRTRRLWQILETGFLHESTRILHFSPSRSIYRLFKRSSFNYISSDLSGDFLADAAYDITQIDAPAESFDGIICYHILEHITDDRKAMQEMHRVLKPGGFAIIQTPFKAGTIYEDKRINTPSAREIHFGQDDHVRIYSVEGLKTRLEAAGFQVEVRNFQEAPDNRYGFRPQETVLIARKLK